MTNFEPKNNQKSTEIDQNCFTDFDQNNQILIDRNLLISYFLAIIYFFNFKYFAVLTASTQFISRIDTLLLHYIIQKAQR